jgi:hypothetical protein
MSKRETEQSNVQRVFTIRFAEAKGHCKKPPLPVPSWRDPEDALPHFSLEVQTKSV